MIKPNFERDRFEGQMNPEERKAIFDLIIKEKPETVFEVGTCRGGGSTYFISCALENNDYGTLFTCENFKEFYDYAIALYNKDEEFQTLAKRIKFHFGNSLAIYPAILRQISEDRKKASLNPLFIDFCILDGGSDSMQMVYDFAMFRPYMPVGSYLICHDWDDGKTDYIRPILRNEHDWDMVELVKGLAIYRRKSNIHDDPNHCT